MKSALISLFIGILIVMLAVTTWASLEENILEALRRIWSDRWFVATLMDAIFGFLTFFVWVAYKEKTLLRKLIWFILIFTLGNIAMSIYVLIQLSRLRSGDQIDKILLREDSRL